MGVLKFIGLGLAGAIVAVAIYARLAPIDAERWHNPNVPVLRPGSYPALGSHVVQRHLNGDGFDTLARLDAIIRATPRTRVVAGTVNDGKVTYVTRSRVMGFPDFTTVTLAQNAQTETSALQVYGRLRFGKSDLGVNRARIEAWMAQLDADGGTDTPDP